MAEYIYLSNKDTLIIKPSKKSPLLLRLIALLFAVVCGVFFCSIRLKQMSIGNRIRFQPFQVLGRSYSEYGIKQIEISGENDTKQLEVPPVYHLTQIEVPGNNDTEQFEFPPVHYPKPQTFNRTECAHNPVQYFAIISMQRSGSGWFETLLNSHMNVSSNGEIFSVMDRRQNVSSIIKTLDTVYNLDLFTSASKNECSAAVGFKWMLNQGLMQYHKEIVEYFNRRGVSVIFLFRRNLLRRLVSVLANSYDRYAKLLNGTHKSHVHSHQEVTLSLSLSLCAHTQHSFILHDLERCGSNFQAEALSRYKPAINSTLLIAELKEMELTAAKAFEYFNSTRHIVLYYEDLVKNRKKLKEVLEFLRLPQMKLKSRQVKIHRGTLSEHIQNWNDVKKTLNGTEYGSLLLADYRR
ncbi:Sulfotransferase [Citrus sinensis]|uniref:Sulfotransferase n=1 Tax=Citrus sinensis TaxID=2711 RepID=A0ACB8J299_CITSI|nr:Sulfotransferase [Citrus sinensis]